MLEAGSSAKATARAETTHDLDERTNYSATRTRIPRTVTQCPFYHMRAERDAATLETYPKACAGTRADVLQAFIHGSSSTA